MCPDPGSHTGSEAVDNHNSYLRKLELPLDATSMGHIFLFSFGIYWSGTNWHCTIPGWLTSSFRMSNVAFFNTQYREIIVYKKINISSPYHGTFQGPILPWAARSPFPLFVLQATSTVFSFHTISFVRCTITFVRCHNHGIWPILHRVYPLTLQVGRRISLLSDVVDKNWIYYFLCYGTLLPFIRRRAE